MIKPDRIIVALDFDCATSAWSVVQQLGDRSTFYKVGLQLLTLAGPDFVRRLIAADKRVFLDLKSYEIPQSVAGAVDSAGRLGCSMVSVHASGGRKALEAAVEAAIPYPELTVLALTVVSSMSDSDLDEVGVPDSVEKQVLRLASLAIDSGCGGLIASPLETRLLRENLSADTIIVTPGIRLGDCNMSDRGRVVSPANAMEAGATFLIIGQSITRARNPLSEFSKAISETA